LVSIKGGEVIFIAHPYALFRSAICLTLPAKDTAVIIAVYFPYALFRVIYDFNSIGRTDLGTRQAADAIFIIWNRLAAEFLRRGMRLKGELAGIGSFDECPNCFSKFP
jgi:hypothetical protein